jgi:hypothetical protein
MPRRMLFALTLGAALASQACTLVGLAVGNEVDARAQKRAPAVPVEDEKVAHISKGTPVVVMLDSGEQIEGRYAGLNQAGPSSEYAALYAAARDRLIDTPLPAFGQHVVLSMPTERAITGEFQGFASDGVFVRPDGQALAHPFRLRQTVSLSSEKTGALASADVERLIANRRLPVLTRLTIDKRQVPFQEVQALSARPRGRKGMWTGLVVGAAMDALVVAWASQQTYDFFGPPLPSARNRGN